MIFCFLQVSNARNSFTVPCPTDAPASLQLNTVTIIPPYLQEVHLEEENTKTAAEVLLPNKILKTSGCD